MALNQNGKLAVAATVAGGWRDFWQVWMPVVLLEFLAQLPFLLSMAWGGGQLAWPGRPTGGAIALFSLGYVLAALWAILLHIVVVRLLLVGREAAFKLSPKALAMAALRYIWKGLQIMVIMLGGILILLIPIGIVAGATLGIQEGSPEPGAPLPTTLNIFVSLTALAVVALILLIYVRFFGAFYAISLEEKVRFRDAWARTRGNTWRSVLSLVPPALVFTLLGIAFPAAMAPSMGPADPAAASAGAAGLAVTLGIVGFFMNGWALGILANIYRNFWPVPAAGSSAEA